MRGEAHAIQRVRCGVAGGLAVGIIQYVFLYTAYIYILLNNIIVYYYIEYIHCTKLYRVILYYMLIIYYVQYTVAIINILYITVVIIIIITYPLISSYI